MKLSFLISILFSAFATAGDVQLNVPQGTYVFGREPALKWVEASVTTCIALSIIDPVTGNLFFAHVDAGNDHQKTLDQAVALFSELNIPLDRLRAYIAGGIKGWPNEGAFFRTALKERKVNVVSYEEPLDVGQTLADFMSLRPPERPREEPIRTYIFNIQTMSMQKTRELHPGSPALPPGSTLRAAYLPNNASVRIIQNVLGSSAVRPAQPPVPSPGSTR